MAPTIIYFFFFKNLIDGNMFLRWLKFGSEELFFGGQRFPQLQFLATLRCTTGATALTGSPWPRMIKQAADTTIYWPRKWCRVSKKYSIGCTLYLCQPLYHRELPFAAMYLFYVTKFNLSGALISTETVSVLVFPCSLYNDPYPSDLTFTCLLHISRFPLCNSHCLIIPLWI